MKKIIANTIRMALAGAFLAASSLAVLSQSVTPTPSPAKPPTGSPDPVVNAAPPAPKITKAMPRTPPSANSAPSAWTYSSRNYGGGTYEKAIGVEPNVNLSLCVSEGTIKVNGWDRNELRVFVQDGSKFAFKVLEKSQKTGNPVWIMVNSAEPAGKFASQNDCIAGDEIEIDVPTNASVSIKGREINTSVDMVRKASISAVGGDITLRNIKNGINASAGQGDIMVEESEGAMTLESTTGNILVFEVGPSEIGDLFKAKTSSGNVSLQKLGHRQIEVNSISGSVSFGGEVLAGGSYVMGTTTGSIRLALPVATACRVVATYRNGAFTSDIPFKRDTENISEGPITSLVGRLGEGSDSVLKLSAINGSILIKKQ